jgi:hypothetical protein
MNDRDTALQTKNQADSTLRWGGSPGSSGAFSCSSPSASWPRSWEQ